MMDIKELLNLSDDDLLAREDVRRAYYGDGPWLHDWQLQAFKGFPLTYKCSWCGKVEPQNTRMDAGCIPPLITDPIEVVAEVLWRKALGGPEYKRQRLFDAMEVISEQPNYDDGYYILKWWAYHATSRHRLIAALCAMEEAAK